MLGVFALSECSFRTEQKGACTLQGGRDLSGMFGWKIQSQLERAHRAGGSLRLVWSCPSQLCLK